MTQLKLQPIDAIELTVGKFFTAEYDFVFLDYQRRYSWGKDETLQCLDDPGLLDRHIDEA